MERWRYERGIKNDKHTKQPVKDIKILFIHKRCHFRAAAVDRVFVTAREFFQTHRGLYKPVHSCLLCLFKLNKQKL